MYERWLHNYHLPGSKAKTKRILIFFSFTPAAAQKKNKKLSSILKPLRQSVLLALHFFYVFKPLHLRKKMANGLAVIHHKATKGSPEGILIDLVFI